MTHSIVFDKTKDIRSGARKLLYSPYDISSPFGATRFGDLSVLVCEVTGSTQVRLLDDLARPESIKALGRPAEEYLKRWNHAHPAAAASSNPNVYRITFRWTGITEARQYMSIVEEEDAHVLAQIDKAVMALEKETP